MSDYARGGFIPPHAHEPWPYPFGGFMPCEVVRSDDPRLRTLLRSVLDRLNRDEPAEVWESEGGAIR